MKKTRLFFGAFAIVLAVSGAFATTLNTAEIDAYLQVEGGPCELKRTCNNIEDVVCKFGSADVFKINTSGTQCITPLFHKP